MAKKNKYGGAMSLYGVQVNDIQNNIFNNTKGLSMHLEVGKPIVNDVNINYYKSGKIEVTGSEKYNVQNLDNIKLVFKAGTFDLSDDSSLRGKGTDNLNLGTAN